MLNDKQKRFVAEYLIDLNATQSAVRAGYSARTAYSQGQRLLKHVEVATALESGYAKVADKLEITQERIAAELAKIGFSDIRRMFTPSGALVPLHELCDDAAGALSSFEVVTKRVPGGEASEVEHVAKIKLWDKRAALVDLGKHVGMFKEPDAPAINVNLDLGDTELARLIVFQLTKAQASPS